MSEVTVQTSLDEWQKLVGEGGKEKHWADNERNWKRFTNLVDKLGLSTGDVAIALDVNENVREFPGTFTQTLARLEEFASAAVMNEGFIYDDDEFDPQPPKVQTVYHEVEKMPEMKVEYAALPIAPPKLEELMDKLADPFAPEQVEWKPQATYQDKALAVAYADPRAYIDRLNEVVGGRWSDDYEVMDGGRVVLCKLTVCGVTRADVGESESNDQNTATSALAQAFKRACVKFGLGRYLYALPKTWVEYDPEKKRITQRGLQQLDALLQAQKSAKTGGNGKPPEDRGLEWAKALKTSRGTLMGKCSADQLTWIIENPKRCTDDQVTAAKLLLDSMMVV